MKVAELLDRRRKNWQALERLCDRGRRSTRASTHPEEIERFASLYRAACADLALADAYQLPPSTVEYLHRLVGRAHNQLYRTHPFRWAAWGKILFDQVPQQIFRDRCVQAAFLLFWGAFLFSALLARSESVWPEYAEQMMTSSFIEQLQENFSSPPNGRNPEADFQMASFYIRHNTSIGLKCFVGGLLVLPGLFITMSNATLLGAAFGYMTRPDVYDVYGKNFFEFVPAHGPFELTAIVLSAGAGLRLGFAWLAPQRLTRKASLLAAGREAMPLMGTAMCLFFLAALIEGFVSPSALHWTIKAGVGLISALLLMFYFVILGYPRKRSDGTG